MCAYALKYCSSIPVVLKIKYVTLKRLKVGLHRLKGAVNIDLEKVIDIHTETVI